MERCGIFIDAGYFSKVLKDFGVSVDYSKLSAKLADEAQILRTYYYDCPPYVSANPTPDERERKSKFDKFVKYLGSLPRFEFKRG